MSSELLLDRLLDQAQTRRELLRKVGVGGAMLSAPAVLTACGSSSTKRAGTGGRLDHLTWLGGAGVSLDCAKDGAALNSIQMATEPIVVLDSDLHVVGHLAEKWEAVNPTTYVYTIRRGVKFWDGTPLTAEDVAFAMDRHRDPKVASLLAGLITVVNSIDVTGEHQVTVKLKQPYFPWIYMPALMLVAPKKLIQELGKDFGAPGKPLMGTGPFKLTDFQAGGGTEFVANDHYWGQKPVAKKLTIVSGLTDAQSALLAMRAGAADGTFAVSTTILRDWERIPDVTVTVKPASVLLFASFDVEAEPWNDVHLRRAFAYALDREGLRRALIGNGGDICDSIIPRNMWGGTVPEAKLDEMYGAVPVYDYDLDKARAELAQSKYPDGLTATIWYYGGDIQEKVSLTWAQALKQIGVTLKLEVASDQKGTNREDNHVDLGFHLNDSWTPDYPDPVGFPDILLRGDHARRGYFNEANYKNPEVDRLVKGALASIDVAERARLMAQVMKIAAEDVPYIPIWTRGQAMALSKGFVYDDFVPPAETQFWIDRVHPAA